MLLAALPWSREPFTTRAELSRANNRAQPVAIIQNWHRARSAPLPHRRRRAAAAANLLHQIKYSFAIVSRTARRRIDIEFVKSDQTGWPHEIAKSDELFVV